MNKKTMGILGAVFMGSVGVIDAYDMHEWGTFTTLSGSDGVLLSGMEVEEESLPFFVQDIEGMNEGVNKFLRLKGVERPLAGVTVKMETPVVYFYGDQRERVSVEVGFNGGAISQWYPPRTSGEKLLAPIKDLAGAVSAKASGKEHPEIFDLSKKHKGFIHWDAEIIPREEVDSSLYFRVGETKNWIYPQVPDSSIVKVGDVYEQYLFYRGLGDFSLPLVLSVDSAETLKIDFKGSEEIPFALVYEKEGSKIRYKLLKEGLQPGESFRIKDDGDWTELKGGARTDAEVYQIMRDGLVAQGLTEYEANGMVKTWWKSYFQHDGLRVFWVLPQVEVERILPMTLSPKPESSVRVIVGRSEVLRPRFEKKLLSFKTKYKSLQPKPFIGFGRYYLAYDERVKALKASVLPR